MALSDLEKQSFKRGIADEAASEALLAIINSGEKADLSEINKVALKNAIAHSRVEDEIIAAFEAGSALGDEAKQVLRQLMGSDPEGDSLITEVEAIS